MLLRLYADNFGCFVNFELKLGPTALLAGRSGSGKSMVFDALSRIRLFVAGFELVSNAFPPQTRTRWLRLPLQRFELDLDLGEQGIYHYQLAIRHDQDSQTSRVEHEAVAISGSPVYQFSKGEVSLFNGGSPPLVYPADTAQSPLASLPDDGRTKHLAFFRLWMFNLRLIQIEPKAMKSLSDREIAIPRQDMADFASWYRQLSLDSPSSISRLRERLQETLQEFDGLRMLTFGQSQPGLSSRLLIADFRFDGKPYPLKFEELSEGQKTLVALYTLLETLRENGGSIFIDEPDNFVTLAEIEPLIGELCEVAHEKHGQVVFASHHPEVLDHPEIEQKFLFSRERGGPTRPPQVFAEPEGLTRSAWLARGWDQE